MTASHGSGKRPKKVDPVYRPGAKQKRELKFTSIREMTNISLRG